MTFSSLIFLIFMVALLAVTAMAKRETTRRIELLLASCVFYGFWSYWFLLLLIGVAVATWLVGLWMLRSADAGKSKRGILTFGIVIMLLVLGFFKYFNFFVDSFCRVFGVANSFSLNILLPVGISFYIFSAIGYLLDVYYNEFEKPVGFFELMLYIMFFPKILQGPMLKAKDFVEQLAHDHPITLENLEAGVQIFLFGLIKKVVIADRLGPFVDAVYSLPEAYNWLTLLLVILTYPIQLYCDFSGYSDMAVGVSRMLGYDMCRNFNLPFLSKSVAEYWRRWHMSLNIWFRDYLFYPILRSGWVNRLRKRAKQRSKKFSKILPSIIGMAIIWPLIGLWHGAAWNFVLHGAIYGVLMIAGLMIKEWKLTLPATGVTGVLQTLRTAAVTILLMVLFRAPDLHTVGVILSRIATLRMGIRHYYTWSLVYIPLVALACVFAYRKNKGEGYYMVLNLGKFKNKLLFSVAAMLTVILMYVGENYFMYFQF